VLVDFIIIGVGSFSDYLKIKIKCEYVYMFVYVCVSDLMSATGHSKRVQIMSINIRAS
jgi:hypothetical protein